MKEVVCANTQEQIEDAEQALKWWLVSNAEAGIPELALIEVLRTYANTVEQLGYVPWSWDPVQQAPYSKAGDHQR